MTSTRSKTIFLAAMVVVFISIIAVAYMALIPYIDHPSRDLSKNIDWSYLNRGLDRIHGFRDTLSWWTGPWCGEVPFWRPLTSYVFWGERLLWPKELMLPRQVIHLILHLVFVGMAGYLVWKLTRRRWLVLMSVWLFAGFRPFFVTEFFGYNPALRDLLGNPKNVMDPLAGIAMMASLLLLLKGRWPASLGFAAVSVGFKEIGFMTWPMALLIVLWMRWSMTRPLPSSTINRSSAIALAKEDQPSPIQFGWLPVSAWAGGFVILAVVHYFGVGFGYRMGTNAAWLSRAELYFGGPVGRLFILDDPSPAIVSLLVFLAIVGFRKLSLLPRFVGIMAALAVGVLLDTHLQNTTWDASAVRLLTYRLDLKIVLVCLFWLLVAWESRRDWKTVGFGLGICLAASLPSWTATQTQEHTRYIGSFFMEMAVAAALFSSFNGVWKTLSQSRKVSSAYSGSE